jgi:hypothetical protein
MVTTRNVTLDALTLGSPLGAEPVDKDVLKTKLIFGVRGDQAHSGEGNSVLRAARLDFIQRCLSCKRANL